MSLEPSLQLVVGLGNPGARYQDTRHNVGFWWVEALARELGAGFRKEARFLGELCTPPGLGNLRLFKPTTFMNRSGAAVAACVRYFKLSAPTLLVIHDELDLPAGSVRLKRGGGHGGHNGLRDIVSALGSPDFWRLRIGIGHPGHRDQVTDYVLHRPSGDERVAIEEALRASLELTDLLLSGQFNQVMNRLHGRASASPGHETRNDQRSP